MSHSIDIDSMATEIAAVLRRHLEPSESGPRVLTMEELVKRTGRSRAWLYARMAAGELPFVQLSAQRRGVRPEDLEAFLLARRA